VPGVAAADGRRERRERNRDSVVEAVLAMVHDGDLAPGADAVAARAGLSARSIFRYFDDLDDLCRAAIERQLTTVGPFLHDDISAAGPADERVAAVVGQRARLFDAMGCVGTFARLRAPFQPLVAEQLAAVRLLLRDRMRSAFAPELAGLDADAADALVAGADVMCSFEAFRLLLDDHGRSVDEAAAVMVAGVRALLAAAEVHA
jgi:AcrR family transcriptional regulator